VHPGSRSRRVSQTGSGQRGRARRSRATRRRGRRRSPTRRSSIPRSDGRGRGSTGRDPPHVSTSRGVSGAAPRGRADGGARLAEALGARRLDLALIKKPRARLRRLARPSAARRVPFGRYSPRGHGAGICRSVLAPLRRGEGAKSTSAVGASHDRVERNAASGNAFSAIEHVEPVGAERDAAARAAPFEGCVRDYVADRNGKRPYAGGWASRPRFRVRGGGREWGRRRRRGWARRRISLHAAISRTTRRPFGGSAKVHRRAARRKRCLGQVDARPGCPPLDAIRRGGKLSALVAAAGRINHPYEP